METKYFIEDLDTNEWYVSFEEIISQNVDFTNPHKKTIIHFWTNDPTKARQFDTHEEATHFLIGELRYENIRGVMRLKNFEFEKSFDMTYQRSILKNVAVTEHEFVGGQEKLKT